MADMITVAEIEDLYGQELTSAEETEVALYIDLAKGEIEAWLGRYIEITAVTSEQVLPDAAGVCYFKETPVQSITALTINDEVVSTPADFITITPYGIDNLWEQTLEVPTLATDQIDRVGFYWAEVVVSYTAGLDLPNGIKSLITFGVLNKFRKEVANRVRASSGHVGIKKIEVEDYSLEYERPLASSRSSGTSSITIFESPDTDFASIKRYKRRSFT